MTHLLLLASLVVNVGFLVAEYEVEDCYECDAYEDFLEEWHRYDELRQQDEAEDFEYELPPEEYEEPPTEEI